MPQENIEDETSFVGQDISKTDFYLGFCSSRSAATIGFGLNDKALATIAASQYTAASRSMQLDRDRFLDGWIAAWKMYQAPVVEVIVILAEKGEHHGDCV